jgi:acyl carrier protein
MSVEEHFGITIPDDDASTLTTVGKLHFWVVNELQRLKTPEVDSTVVFQELRQLICDQLGIAPDRVIPEARFVLFTWTRIPKERKAVRHWASRGRPGGAWPPVPAQSTNIR